MSSILFSLFINWRVIHCFKSIYFVDTLIARLTVPLTLVVALVVAFIRDGSWWCINP